MLKKKKKKSIKPKEQNNLYSIIVYIYLYQNIKMDVCIFLKNTKLK